MDEPCSFLLQRGTGKEKGIEGFLAVQGLVLAGHFLVGLLARWRECRGFQKR